VKDSVVVGGQEEVESFAVIEWGIHGDGSFTLWLVRKRVRGEGDGWMRRRCESVQERCLKK
jgi:hypothetical protein